MTSSTMENRESRQYSLVFFLIFTVLAAGIVGAGYVYFRNFREHFRTGVKSNLSAIADLKIDELARWRAERLRDAEVLFKNPAFSVLVQRALEQPDPTGAHGRLQAWLSAIRNAYDYDRVFLLDDQGLERAAAPDTPETVAPHLKEALSGILRSGRVAFQDFHSDTPDGPVHLSVLVPVLAGDNPPRSLGVLVLRIDPAQYLYPYIVRWPVPSRTAETLIVRREGDEVAFLNELRFNRGPVLSVRFPISVTSLPAARAALGHEGVMDGIDYRGMPVVAAIRAVPGSPWFLVARVDADEAYAPLWERLFGVALFLGVLLLGIAAAVGLFWRHQRARFYRERYHAAEALRAVSLRQAALLSAVPDIIMEVDDRKMYTWANPAGLQFFGEDVVGKDVDFYFEGEQDTYRTVQPLFNGHEGVIYVESWQRRKDGEKRLLAWWCRVLKDENGRVTGALSTARDITELNRAEEAVAESEKKYRALFETMSEGIVYEDYDGKIISANPAAERLLGLSLDQMQGRTSLDPRWKAIHEDGSPFPGETHSLNVAAKTGKPATGEVMGIYNPKSGAYVWLSVNSTPEFLPGEKKPFRAYAVFRDITERKRAEEELRTSEAKFRGLFEWMGGGIQLCEMVFDEEGRPIDNIILDVNPAYEKHSGIARELVVGKRIKEILPIVEQAWLDRYGKLVRTREPVHFEEYSASLDRWFDVHASSMNGNRIAAFFTDITERKRAEEAQAIQKRIGDIFLTKPGDEIFYEVLKIILEAMESPFGVFGYIDESGALVVPSMTRHIWDRCQVPKKTITFPRETWGHSSWPRAVLEKKPNYSNEISTKTPEGHVLLKRHISLPILYLGEVIGLFQVANKETDYTEADVRLLETIAEYVAPILSTQLERLRHEEELQAKNDELIRFTYTVSHDLKSPLVTIRTFLGYLEQDIRKPDAGEVDKDLTYIRNAADRASRQLDELLELSRIGRKVNPPVEVPLQDLVKEALDLVAGRIVKRGVTVEVTKDPILLFGDRTRLVEVFQNLVDNAVKFMGRERVPRVEIGVDEVGGETVFFVRDNGIGIKPEYQTKLFGLFEKLDPGSDGTGIGLALVKRIVEVHGGRIWVESEGPGKGTTFRFTLEKAKRKPVF